MMTDCSDGLAGALGCAAAAGCVDNGSGYARDPSCAIETLDSSG